MKNFKQKINKNKGYAILETLFYIALLVVLTTVVLNSMLVMMKSFKETKIKNELVQSSFIMERISREVRKALDINTINATDLKLDTKDDAGIGKNIEFRLVGTDIQLLETGKTTVNLNTPNIFVTDLSFRQITTIKGKAVKIVLSLKSNNDTANRIIDFYNTIVLRGKYK